MGSGVARTVSGVYVGTGAAQDIKYDKVGFEPKCVRIYRKTTAIDLAEHINGMDDASFFKTVGTTGVRTLVTTQGITLNSTGFSVGTDASINNSGDTYLYVCEE